MCKVVSQGVMYYAKVSSVLDRSVIRHTAN